MLFIELQILIMSQSVLAGVCAGCAAEVRYEREHSLPVRILFTARFVNVVGIAECHNLVEGYLGAVIINSILRRVC
jgi:hypothetical protein